MDEEHRKRLELAQLDARRRRHSHTDPEHLLAVLLAVPSEAKAIETRGLDPLELGDRIEAHFADRPAASAYRDGGGAPPSEALERVLRRMKGRRWMPLLGRVPMLEALFLEPSIAKLVFELRRGPDARAIVERAKALAVLSSHRSLALAHVFRALLDLSSFVDTLERAAGDVEALRTFLETWLRGREVDDATDVREAPFPEMALRRVLYTGTFPAADAAPMTIRQLSIALAREDDCDPFWEAARVTRADFLLALHLPDL